MQRLAADQIQPVPWPKDDEIRWVQWRVWEREAIEAGKSADWDKKGAYSLTDYRAWLRHERELQRRRRCDDVERGARVVGEAGGRGHELIVRAVGRNRQRADRHQPVGSLG